MAVRVFTSGNTSIDINNGETWVVRQDKQLTVFDRSSKEVAEFVAGHWTAVVRLLEIRL